MTSLMNETPIQSLGRKIRTARVVADIKQADLARACGVSRSAVSQWEHGETEPSASKLFAIARATNQPLGWFAEGLIDGVVRLEGLEPPTFWLGVAWSRLRQRLTREGAFWTPERRSILADLERQVQPDSEIPTGSGSAR